MSAYSPCSAIAATLVVLLSSMVSTPLSMAQVDEPKLAHAVYFRLKDQSPRSREEFIASCEKYLDGHKGAVSFTVGTIAEDVTEPVSDREFDVALHVVFENKSMLEAYLKSEKHDKFVDENKAKFAKVRVFDSYLPLPKVKAAAIVHGI